MTVRQVYEAVAIELNKMHAPILKLFDFNYLCNKAITQYVNKIYNVFGVNQQATDDLRVLESTIRLTPSKDDSPNATYVIKLPIDYLHLLNCVCVYNVNKNKGCWKKGNTVEIPATRMVSDSWNQISTDVYNKPSPTRPYYFIHNVNIPTEPSVDLEDSQENQSTTTFNLLKAINKQTSKAPVRKGNVSDIRCEIRCGKATDDFELKEVCVDYLKVPQQVCLTQEQVDLIEDRSQEMEFPNYVNYEIINELVHLVMEKISDPRLGNHIQMTQTIARPTGQQSQ